MSSITELTRYIRFQLSQLRTLNKHHEFESLARQFARLRICENIIPATGPVGSGGDQGRDFETYRSYLCSTPIATSTFLGIDLTKKIVFACSLQENVGSKIKSDIKTICNGGEQIDAIYYFSEKDVTVAKRHKLQKWSRDKFGTELEIFDGEALAEQLTALDVFWIAEEYLDVPSEMYPRVTQEPALYAEYKQYWLEGDRKPYSYSDFFQIKYGLRRATFQSDAKPDLTRWIAKMETFRGEGYPQDLSRRATYEVCVASLRGQNNLTAKRTFVEDYFSNIDNLQSISKLEDATTLLSYCSSAYLYGHFEIEAEQLFEWTKNLIKQIDKVFNTAPGPGSRCSLLMIRGQAAYLQFKEGTNPTTNFDETFDFWFRLLNEVENAPLFPLECLADLLCVMKEFIGEDSRFIKLSSKIDELLSIRTSGFVAAEKCRERALAYYRSKKYLLAIKQLHQVKIKWFTAETLRGSLLAMLILSDCYQRLGLLYAAKYYAAGVAYIAFYQDVEEIKPLLPRALFSLADCFYAAGEWLSFVQIVQVALSTHNMYDNNPLEIEKHEDLQRTFGHFAILRTITRRLNTDLAAIVDAVFAEWPIDQCTRRGLESLSGDQTSYWQNAAIDLLWKSAQKQLYGRPFCDVGETRSIQFKALGIDWCIQFQNEHTVASISEEFISTLQIILADLAGEVFLLLPTKVEIECYISDGDQVLVEEKPSNEIATWKVGIPKEWIQKSEHLDKIQTNVISIASTVLGQCSALSYETRINKFKIVFSEGLIVKAFFVRPYAELYAQFMPANSFLAINRKPLSPIEPNREFSTVEHEELKWVDGFGPGYSKKKAREFLINRYTQGIRPVRLTLPRLLQREDFRIIVRKLKNEGYLDWQILLMINNIAVDYRVNRILPPGAFSKERIAMMNSLTKDLLFRDETEDDIEVPSEIFTEDRIEIQKRVSLGAIARTWKLMIHHSTFDFKALAKLLDVRYKNSTDDIEHDDIFGV